MLAAVVAVVLLALICHEAVGVVLQGVAEWRCFMAGNRRWKEWVAVALGRPVEILAILKLDESWTSCVLALEVLRLIGSQFHVDRTACRILSALVALALSDPRDWSIKNRSGTPQL